MTLPIAHSDSPIERSRPVHEGRIRTLGQLCSGAMGRILTDGEATWPSPNANRRRTISGHNGGVTTASITRPTGAPVINRPNVLQVGRHRLARQRGHVLRRVCSPSTSRSGRCPPSCGQLQSGEAQRSVLLGQHLVLVSSSFTCQWRVSSPPSGCRAARTGGLFDIRANGAWSSGSTLTYFLGAVFVVGQIYEYALLVSEGVGLAERLVRFRLLPHHRLPRPPRDRRPHRLPAPHRPRRSPSRSSPTKRRRARSSSRTTGTSSTWSGSACSSSSTCLKSRIGTSHSMPCEDLAKGSTRRTGRRHPLATVALHRDRPRRHRRRLRRRHDLGAPAESTAEHPGPHRPRAASSSPPTAPPATAWRSRAPPTVRRSIGVGAAAVEFQVATGRMPLAATGPAGSRRSRRSSPPRTSRRCTPTSRRRGPGPGIPDEKYLQGDGDAAVGAELFRINCAMCHNVAGAGGALTEGKYAPALDGVEPIHVYEAMVTGPQNMPVFNDMNISPEDKANIITYLQYLENEPAAGGSHARVARPGLRGPVHLDLRARRDRGASRCG